MTKLEGLYSLLDRTFPNKVAYRAFPENEAPEMPYVIINEQRTDNFAADNQVYNKRIVVDLELYTKTKSPGTEQTLEDALDLANIFYNASDLYLDDERCFERIYEIEV